jgi:DNA-binding MarR family transcriptional regulator
MARVASVGSSEANRRLGDLGLKVRHYSVLALACSDEGPTQRELSEFLVLDPSQVVAILDELEHRGAVERRTDPRDRRSKIIVPTPGGRELYAQAKEFVDAAADRSLAALSPAQRQELTRLLWMTAF